jgi:serine kinase of HPr protein (carbohydrate metabolism regulator)
VAAEGPLDPAPGAYVHATALAIGEAGLLIRGPSGAGKSRLALDLLTEAGRRGLFARLVGDDRLAVAQRAARLLARPHPAIAGRIESRGEAILEVPFEPAIVIRLVIDLHAAEAVAPPRLPFPDATARVCGLDLPSLTLTRPGPQQANLVLDYLWRKRNG